MGIGRALLETLLDRPKSIGLGLVGLLAVACLSIPGLRFDTDINRVFLSDSALSTAQRAFEAQGGTSSDVALLIETEAPLSAADLEAARTVALDLEFAEGVIAVASPFALRFPPGHPAFPDAPVLPVDLAGLDLPARLAAFRALGTGLPTFLAARSMLIVATVDTSARPLGQTLAQIRTLARDLDAPGRTATVTGADVVGLAIRDGLTGDLARLNIVGAGLVLGLALVLLGSVRLAVLAVLPGLGGAAATLGLAGWLGYPITVLNNVIPVLMLVLGVANGLHLTVHLAETEGAIRARVRDTLRTVGPASALTAITTALAFASILLTPNAQLREFAVLGAAGVMVTLAVLLAGFAVLATLLRPAPGPVPTWTRRAAERGGALVWRRPTLVCAMGLVCLVASAAGFATTRAWFPLYENLPAGSALPGANDRIAESFGGVFQAWVEMPDGAAWPDLVAAVEAVEAVAPPETVVSEPAIARWLGAPAAAPAPETLAQIPAALRDRLRDPESGTLRFAVALPEPMRSEASLALFDRVEAAALGAGAARVLGLPAIMRHESVALIRQLSIGLVLASLGGAAVVTLAFRSLRLLPVVLVVNLLPVLIVGAALHLLADGHLTPPAVLSLTIAFGIAVDDTIHYLSRFRAARAGGTEAPTAARTALRSAGGVMVMTTVLVCAGLAVTGFSAFFPVRLFGAMLALSLVAALVADIVLLPALLLLGTRHANA